MTISFGNNFTVIAKTWSGFKVSQLSKSLRIQYQEGAENYDIYGYDSPNVYVCTVWKDLVPGGVLQSGYTQEQNDADKADFETNFKSNANQTITPTAADGKPLILPNSFPGEVLLNFAGASDSATRLGGDLFGLQQVGVGTTSQELNFVDGIFLAGGHVDWDGGSWGNYVKMSITAPASTTKAPAIALQGNCNRIPTGYGFDIIVPAAGDGAFDLDVVVPVPASNDETNLQTGYWNYTEPWMGAGTISPGSPGASKYNLYTAPLDLAHMVRVHLFHDSGVKELIAPAIKPKWILPEWKLKVTICNVDTAKTFRVSWDLLIARRKTT